MKANSKGQDLTSHLTAVMHLSMHAAKHLGVKDQELINVIGLSSFLHDIGKCNSYFQNLTLLDKLVDKEGKLLIKEIKSVYTNYNVKSNKLYPRHNEISWLFAVEHSVNSIFKNVGLQSIYWHHGTYDFNPDEITSTSILSNIEDYNDVLTELNDVYSKIKDIINSVQFPFDINKYISLSNRVDDTFPISKIFEEEVGGKDSRYNPWRWIARSCLIFADHTISSLSAIQLEQLLVSKDYDQFFKTTDNSLMDFVCPPQYSAARVDIQKDIINKCGRTTVVKAPAGFGKSLIGVMWGCKQTGQIYWVCPRNNVAECVYKNILQELDAFNIKLSVELFLTSERKDATDKSLPDCKSDIVVTNIDNLLAPMVSHKHCSRIFDINATNVVFDEFHEFASDEALFGAFIVYMKARHLHTENSKTLLLSATPSNFYELFEGSNNKVTVLPNREEHYPAQHNKEYNIMFSNEFSSDQEPSSLTMYNSIKNVQDNYKSGSYTSILHSKYSDPDRKRLVKIIVDSFSKGKDKSGIIISAPILQAAFDISFKSLYKSIESPESDIQTIGRVNRWGELNSANITFINLLSDKREGGAINTRYNRELSELWFKFLQSKIKPVTTLDEIYVVYNDFINSNRDKLREFYGKKFSSALKKLSEFFPKAAPKDNNKDGPIHSGKTLRTSTPTGFIIVKEQGDWYPFIFSAQFHELDKIIADNSKMLRSYELKRVFENIQQIKGIDDVKFDYSNLIKRFFDKKKTITLDKDFIKLSKNSQTPLPVETIEYSSVLGLIASDNVELIDC